MVITRESVLEHVNPTLVPRDQLSRQAAAHAAGEVGLSLSDQRERPVDASMGRFPFPLPRIGHCDNARAADPVHPAEVETRSYERWVSEGYFRADPGSDREPYSIVLPPPNVTGVLHIGHALDHSDPGRADPPGPHAGHETLWLPGMDHAGIATQNVVERELAKDGMSRHDLGREAFVERVWEWKEESGGRILGQMRKLGDGVDWARERFTMDDGLSRAVQTMFKRLFDEGLIYRAERIINWCPRCLTALSDIEVEHSEDEGELVSIRYGEGDDAIVVATTRAETMLGDTAVAVHPADERYAHLVGTQVELPLTGRHDPDRGRRARRPGVRHRRGQGDARRTTPTTSRSAAATRCRR